MATIITTISSILFAMLLPSLFLIPTCGLTHELAGMKQMQKESHLHFFFHDVVSGRNATAVPVTDPVKPFPSSFGMVVMVDDLLTEGPDPTSTPVGRAQGLYAFAAQQELGLLVALNFVFTQGMFSGSTLTVLGRNPALLQTREMPVVGGSGLFRFARGYAQAHTHFFDLKTGNVIVEYDVFVMHS